jgi:excisionase family DNA binding protein
MTRTDNSYELPHQHMLTEAELAQRWKVSKRTIQRWRHEGRLPDAFRIGRKVLFRIDVVTAFECTFDFEVVGR